jgi:hypothetical protein
MNDTTENTPEIPSELDTLKQRANTMGIKFHHKIGVDKLKILIDNKLNGSGIDSTAAKKILSPKKEEPLFLTHAQFTAEQAGARRRDINRLVRVRVTCMNPNKSSWEGEIISVGSAKLGTLKKYVPFNSEEGWHIPFMMYEAMKERKHTVYYNVKGPRGEKIRKGKEMPEFSIDVLPPLNPAELKDLAQRQLAARQAT